MQKPYIFYITHKSVINNPIMDQTFPIAKHLVWNDHDRHITTAFCELVQKKSLTDVSIVCADKTILAHKLLLSVASPFFHRIIEENPCKHPIIILHDYPSWVIEMILGFVYCGELHIPHEAVFAFIETAKDLEIKGLNFISEIKSPSHVSPSQQPRRKQPKPNRLLEQENAFVAPMAPLDFSLKSNVTSTSNVMMCDERRVIVNESCMEKQNQDNGDELVGQVVHETVTVETEKSVEAVLTPPKKKVRRSKAKSLDKDLLSLPYPTMPCKY